MVTDIIIAAASFAAGVFVGLNAGRFSAAWDYLKSAWGQ